MSCPCGSGEAPSLLSLPDLCLSAILGRLDGASLARMEAVASSFSRPLLESTARSAVTRRCSNARPEAERFR